MSERIAHNAEDRQRAAELAKHADALSARLLDVTTCMYKPDSEGNAEAAGSAVLLALGPAHFLVSAAHVLDQRMQHVLHIPTGESLQPIEGEFTRVYSESATSIANDHVDIGIARLAPRLAQMLPTSHFATWDEIDHFGPKLARHAFGFLGYPLTKQRSPIKGRFIVAQAYRMAAMECEEATYESEGREAQVSILLGVEHRKMWSPLGQVTAPDLYGASGGGVWRFGRRLRDAKDPPRLAGIAIEWHKKGKNKYVLATRIQVAIAALTQTYRDVYDAVETHLGGAA